MKRLATILALSIIVMGGAMAQSPDDQAVFVRTTNPDIYKLIVASGNKSNVTFKISNEKGKEIFRDKIHNVTGFIKPYNFQRLPKGMYALEVEKGSSILEQTIIHEKGFKSEEFASIFINVNQQVDDKVALQVVGANNRTVQVNIKDTFGQTVYTDEVSGLMGFKRTYDLANFKSDVAFEVTIGDETVFSENF